MKSTEVIRKTFGLSIHDAEFIARVLLPGEEIITKVGPKMQEWLKAKAKETNYQFLTVTVRGSTLYIYVRTDPDTIEALPFRFKGNRPLDELWRASISADFKDNYHTRHTTFVPHRPN